MPLIITEISQEVPPLARELQQIGRGSNVFVVVRATMLAQAEQRHWLCQPDSGVPLDVSIAHSTGEIASITVFLLDVAPLDTAKILIPPAVVGYPRVDLGSWDQRKRQLVERGRPTAVFTGRSLVIGFFGLGTYTQRIDAGCIHFLVSQDAVLAGIILPRFDAASLQLLETSAVLDAAHLRPAGLALSDAEVEIRSVDASTISVTGFFNSQH